jgi:hypothetical protein
MKVIASNNYNRLIEDAKEHAVRKPGDQHPPRIAMDNCVHLRSAGCSLDRSSYGLQELLTESRPLSLIPVIRAPKVRDGRRT